MSKQRGKIGIATLSSGKFKIIIAFEGEEPLYSEQDFDTKEAAFAAMHEWAIENCDCVEHLQ